MNNATNNCKREFIVEGHGAGMLSVIGGEYNHLGRNNWPMLTREEAWVLVQDFQSKGDTYHTIKVCKLNRDNVVWRAIQINQSWIQSY